MLTKLFLDFKNLHKMSTYSNIYLALLLLELFFSQK